MFGGLTAEAEEDAKIPRVTSVKLNIKIPKEYSTAHQVHLVFSHIMLAVEATMHTRAFLQLLAKRTVLWLALVTMS